MKRHHVDWARYTVNHSKGPQLLRFNADGDFGCLIPSDTSSFWSRATAQALRSATLRKVQRILAGESYTRLAK